MGSFKMNSIKLNSGETITKYEILKREIINNNSNNVEAKVEFIMSNILLMNDSDLEKVELPQICCIFNGLQQTTQTSSNSSINQTKSFSKIELLLILLDNNENHGFALSNLCHLMLLFNIKEVTLRNDSKLTLEQIAIKNYLVNSENGIGKDSETCYYYLIDALYPKTKFKLPDGTFVKLEQVLVKGVEKRPNNSLLYYYLSTLYQDNSVNINLNYPNGKGLYNRIDLLVLAIENEYSDYTCLSSYYYYIASFISDNQKISINKETYDRIQLLIASLEFNKSNILSAKLLVELLSPYQKVFINNESYSRVALVNAFIKNHYPVFAYQLLSTIYKQENNIQKSHYYNKLYLKELSNKSKS